MTPDYILKAYGLEKDSYILFLARATAEKRLELLIDAYKQLKTEIKLVIAGGISDSQEYVDLLKEKADDEAIVPEYKLGATEYICNEFGWENTVEMISEIYNNLL